MGTVLDVILDALLDSLKLLPFLFLTYLFMEFLEHKAGDKTRAAMIKAGRVGPLFGAGLGLLPQCGFSAAAAGLYAGRVVTVGTLTDNSRLKSAILQSPCLMQISMIPFWGAVISLSVRYDKINNFLVLL